MSDEITRGTLNNETFQLLLETGRRLLKQQDQITGYDARFAREVIQHGRAVAMFSAEMRKAEKDDHQDAEAASQEERIAAAEAWLARQPPDLLRPVVERLKAFLRKRRT